MVVLPAQNCAEEFPVMTIPAPSPSGPNWFPVTATPPMKALEFAVIQMPPERLFVTENSPAHGRLCNDEKPINETPVPAFPSTVRPSTVRALPFCISMPFPGFKLPATVFNTLTFVTLARDAVIDRPAFILFWIKSPLNVASALSSSTPLVEAFSTVFSDNTQTLKSRHMTPHEPPFSVRLLICTCERTIHSNDPALDPLIPELP